MAIRDQAARDLRRTLLSELTAAQRPLTTAQLRRRINEGRTAELVLETIYRNLCVLCDRDDIQRAGQAGRHTLWLPKPHSSPTDALPVTATANSATTTTADLLRP